MSAALACGPSENTQGPVPAQEQDNGAGRSPRGGETRAGTTDFSAATTRRKAVRPAVKPEAESALGSNRRRGIHRGLGLRAQEGTDRVSLAAEPTARRRELGTGLRASGAEARHTSCRSAAVEASTSALVEAGSGGLLCTRALPPRTWAPQGGHRCPPLQGPGCLEHAARRGGAQGTGSLQRSGHGLGATGGGGDAGRGSTGEPTMKAELSS